MSESLSLLHREPYPWARRSIVIGLFFDDLRALPMGTSGMSPFVDQGSVQAALKGAFFSGLSLALQASPMGTLVKHMLNIFQPRSLTRLSEANFYKDAIGKRYHSEAEVVDALMSPTPISEAPSKTRSGKPYDISQEINKVILDIDAEPFFHRAMSSAHLRGDEDDAEGREFEDDGVDPEGHPVTESIGCSSVSQITNEPFSPRTSAPPIRNGITASHSQSSRQLKSKARRRAQVQKHYLLYPHLPIKYRPHLGTLRICSTLNHTAANIRSETLPSAAGCWFGKRLLGADPSLPMVNHLIRRGLKKMFWNGVKPIGFYDSKDRLLAILVGKPGDANWDVYMDDLSKTMTDLREKGIADGVFKASKMSHRRGRFFAIPAGVSFGTGSKKPGNLKHTVGEKRILDELKEDPNVKRVVGFQHASFACYAPKLYAHYRKVLGKLYQNEPHLRPNFPRLSHFPAMTYNLGPDTATLEHTDCNNVAYGWCAITALGNYNPSKEGHMILYDLGLYITFPPGSTILIPSAVFRHGNTPIICKGSYRQSITQYCAGGLFRWVRYGFKTVKQHKEENPECVLKKEIDGDLQARTEEALSLFSTTDSLEQDRIDILRT